MNDATQLDDVAPGEPRVDGWLEEEIAEQRAVLAGAVDRLDALGALVVVASSISAATGRPCTISDLLGHDLDEVQAAHRRALMTRATKEN